MSIQDPKPRTPVCPACGAKFAHSNSARMCMKCLIPDEIVTMGPRAIKEWQKQQLKEQGKTKHQIKAATRGKRQRHRNKHGRKGV